MFNDSDSDATVIVNSNYDRHLKTKAERLFDNIFGHSNPLSNGSKSAADISIEKLEKVDLTQKLTTYITRCNNESSNQNDSVKVTRKPLQVVQFLQQAPQPINMIHNDEDNFSIQLSNCKTYSRKKKVTFTQDLETMELIKKPKRKTLRKKKEKYPDCTKEALLDAFKKANLPDYEAFAKQELNIIIRKPGEENIPKEQTSVEKLDLHQYLGFKREKINSLQKNNLRKTNAQRECSRLTKETTVSDLKKTLTEDHIHEDTNHFLKIDHATFIQSSPLGKNASTPIATRNITLGMGDVSSIIYSPMDTQVSENLDSDFYTLSSNYHQFPNKRKWNVVTRKSQMTALKPPSSIITSSPQSFPNVESGNYHTMNISNFKHPLTMDLSISKIFTHSSPSILKKLTKDLSINHCDKPNHFYRKSIASISNALSSLGKSCRSIVQEKNNSNDDIRNIENTLSKNKQLTLLMAFGVSYIHKNDKDEILTSKEKVLNFCDPHTISTFNKVLTEKVLSQCVKIGEGSYAEVYKSFNLDGEEIVIKIIPMNISISNEIDVFAQILPELAISSSFNALQNGHENMSPNFIHFLKAACVKGSFPIKLIQEWIKFDKEKGSENENPKTYTNNLHLILTLKNGGVELEKFEFKSAQESFSVFLQTCYSLASAECHLQFEHRDLHWGNILVRPTRTSHLEYKVNGNFYQIKSYNVFISVIDFTLSRIAKDGFIIYDDLSKYEDLFEGKGDYQFEIYRMMKKLNKNNWKKFCPKTNIFWLHYILHKLIDIKKYKSRSKSHQNFLAKLKKIRTEILNYDSAQTLIDSLAFQAIL